MQSLPVAVVCQRKDRSDGVNVQAKTVLTASMSKQRPF
jgi:hypothetical protein